MPASAGRHYRDSGAQAASATPDGGARPVHSILLREEILIAEHLTGLDQLPSGPFSFSAVPPKLVGIGTFPVRAYATLP